eukprot:UN27548
MLFIIGLCIEIACGSQHSNISKPILFVNPPHHEGVTYGDRKPLIILAIETFQHGNNVIIAHEKEDLNTPMMFPRNYIDFLFGNPKIENDGNVLKWTQGQYYLKIKMFLNPKGDFIDNNRSELPQETVCLNSWDTVTPYLKGYPNLGTPRTCLALVQLNFGDVIFFSISLSISNI